MKLTSEADGFEEGYAWNWSEIESRAEVNSSSSGRWTFQGGAFVPAVVQVESPAARICAAQLGATHGQAWQSIPLEDEASPGRHFVASNFGEIGPQTSRTSPCS